MYLCMYLCMYVCMSAGWYLLRKVSEGDEIEWLYHISTKWTI